MTDTIKLGTPVRFSRQLRRVVEGRAGGGGQVKRWEPNEWKKEIQEGIVIGLRRLSNGYSAWNYEDPTEWVHESSTTAYLIAYHLHKAPVYVLADDVEVIHEAKKEKR